MKQPRFVSKGAKTWSTRHEENTPMPAALLPTSRNEREKWGTPTVFSVNTRKTVRLLTHSRCGPPARYGDRQLRPAY